MKKIDLEKMYDEAQIGQGYDDSFALFYQVTMYSIMVSMMESLISKETFRLLEKIEAVKDELEIQKIKVKQAEDVIQNRVDHYKKLLNVALND